MSTEAEVIAFLDNRMEQAKQEIVAEFSAYMDYHLEKYGVFVMPTHDSFVTWQREIKKLPITGELQ